MKKVITREDVKKIAGLANLELTEEEVHKFPGQFNETLEAVERLQEINTDKVKTTFQVTGLTNVWREDEIDQGRTLSQIEALEQAAKSYKGYFVVPRIID